MQLRQDMPLNLCFHINCQLRHPPWLKIARKSLCVSEASLYAHLRTRGSRKALMYPIALPLPPSLSLSNSPSIVLFSRSEIQQQNVRILSNCEERQLTLHIRASSQLDWCSALRRHLLAEAESGAECAYLLFVQKTKMSYTKRLLFKIITESSLG